jgi:hypothetical protein
LLAIKPDEKFHIDKYGYVNVLLIATKKSSVFAQSESVNTVLAADTVVRQN